jgi:hypothetical protein
MRLYSFISAAAIAGVASGVSLRDQLQQHMAAKTRTASTLEMLAKTHKNCAPVKPSTEQRTCANVNTVDGRPENMPPANCKDCFQECDCWGDPHCSPFYSKCTQFVASTQGFHTLFSVPGKNAKFEIFNEPENNKMWIKEFYVNGKSVKNATDCGDPKDHPKQLDVVSDTVTLKDDLGGEAKIRYWAQCRDWKETVSRGTGAPQLVVRVRVQDEHDTYERPPSTEMPPKSTFMFENAEGICVDPPKYGQGIENPSQKDYELKCKRQSPWKFTSGRDCNCSASCAKWGDPHLMDYYTDQGRSSQKCNFLTPITENVQYNMMYHVEQVFGVQSALDEKCKLIQTVTVYGMKKRTKQKLFGCTPQAGELAKGNLDSFSKDYSINDYNIVELDANTHCKNMGDEIVIPSNPNVKTGIADLDAFNKDVYDDDVKGYPLDTQILVYGEDGRQYLVPVQGGMSTCLKKKGFLPDLATRTVKMGGITATAVCHKNKFGEFYFNLCSNKQNMVVQDFVQNGKELEKASQLPKQVPDFKNGMINALEQAAFTGGFCATGNFEGSADVAVQQEVSANAYEHRAVGECKEFVPAEMRKNQ